MPSFWAKGKEGFHPDSGYTNISVKIKDFILKLIFKFHGLPIQSSLDQLILPFSFLWLKFFSFWYSYKHIVCVCICITMFICMYVFVCVSVILFTKICQKILIKIGKKLLKHTFQIVYPLTKRLSNK